RLGRGGRAAHPGVRAGIDESPPGGRGLPVAVDQEEAMNLIFLEAARDELDEAAAYYEKQREGLGEQFAEEVENTLQRILHHPQVWTKLAENTRRCRTNRFPYGVVYQVRGEDIVVVAVMHLRRKPGYWKDRLDS